MYIINQRERKIQHYGVKGMKWGVRKYRSRASRAGAVVRKAGGAIVIGNEKTSLATRRGRKGFKKNVKADVTKGKSLFKRLLKNKYFKAMIYNHDEMKKTIASGKARVKKVRRSFLKASLKAHKKDLASLEEHGFTEEARGIRENIKALERKLNS